MPRKLLSTKGRRRINKLDSHKKLAKKLGYDVISQGILRRVNWGASEHLRNLRPTPLSTKVVGRKKCVMTVLAKKAENERIKNQKKIMTERERTIVRINVRCPAPITYAQNLAIVRLMDNPKIVPEEIYPELKGLEDVVQYCKREQNCFVELNIRFALGYFNCLY